jgi:hypothetical protein
MALLAVAMVPDSPDGTKAMVMGVSEAPNWPAAGAAGASASLVQMGAGTVGFAVGAAVGGTAVAGTAVAGTAVAGPQSVPPSVQAGRLPKAQSVLSLQRAASTINELCYAYFSPL